MEEQKSNREAPEFHKSYLFLTEALSLPITKFEADNIS